MQYFHISYDSCVIFGFLNNTDEFKRRVSNLIAKGATSEMEASSRSKLFRKYAQNHISNVQKPIRTKNAALNITMVFNC